MFDADEWLLIGGGILVFLAVLIGGTWYYGHVQYGKGVAAEDVKVKAAEAVIEKGWQDKVTAVQSQLDAANAATAKAKKDNDALTAELSTQSATIAQDKTNLAAAADKLNNVLRDYASRAQAASASAPVNETGPDWRDLFSQCTARVESLAGLLAEGTDRVISNASRLNAVANDAATYADTVNGLQGYAQALQVK